MLSSEHLSFPNWADDDLATYEANKINPQFSRLSDIQIQIDKNTLDRRRMRVRRRQSLRHIRHFESVLFRSEVLGAAGSVLV